ncbi:MAG TPA: HAD-IIIC family phosphatase [Candidatus Nanoarchaeia archaeon]|nr:HAD-IIIC family phosphatase [Candidatus Nanoarchaeia archaeon]
MKIAILSTFTIQMILPKLKELSEKDGFNHEIKIFVSYNLCSKELTDNQSEIYQFAPDVLFLFIDLDSLIPEYLDLVKIKSEERRKVIDLKFSYLLAIVEKFTKERPASTIIIHNFSVPSYSPLGIADNREAVGLQRSIQDLNRRMEDYFKDNNSVLVFDYDGFTGSYGKKNIIDRRLYFLADIKIKAEYLELLAKNYLNYINSLLGKSKKCLVLDLDNTLWGGIIGEDSPSNLKLGPNPPGNAYLEFQKVLLSLFNKGILLTINSKNNFDDAIKVIREHPQMVLKEKNFSAIRINWQDKATNIREIAEELNIGTNSMVFIDDDQYNRMLVKSVLPEVLTVDISNDPTMYADIIKELMVFDTANLTQEDKVRSKLYAEERERRELQHNLSDFNDFLQELKMEITIGKADESTIPRISQLTQKTNQFNLTTRRYSEAEIKSLASNTNSAVYHIHSKDRLGDAGIVGCAIINIENDSATIDTFLISCRVLGRKIEDALLHHLISEAKNRGVKAIIGSYLPTKKNAQTQNFYKHHGFDLLEESADQVLWILNVENYNSTWPEFIKININ